MQLIKHRWQERWHTQLDSEFKYRIERINSPADSYIELHITCRLWPWGFLAPVGYQLFRASMTISYTSQSINIEDEIEYHIHKRIAELRRAVERTIQSGYSATYTKGDSITHTKMVPILDNWRIDS